MTGNAVTRVRAFVNAQKNLEIVKLSEIYQSNDYLHLFAVDLNTLLCACDPCRDNDSTLVQRLKRMRSEWEADGGESGPPTIQGEMIGELVFALTDPQPLKNVFHAGQEAADMAARQPMREALLWYAEQVAGCRKIGSLGRPFQEALDDDGGKRARAALDGEPGQLRKVDAGLGNDWFGDQDRARAAESKPAAMDGEQQS